MKNELPVDSGSSYLLFNTDALPGLDVAFCFVSVQSFRSKTQQRFRTGKAADAPASILKMDLAAVSAVDPADRFFEFWNQFAFKNKLPQFFFPFRFDPYVAVFISPEAIHAADFIIKG